MQPTSSSAVFPCLMEFMAQCIWKSNCSHSSCQVCSLRGEIWASIRKVCKVPSRASQQIVLSDVGHPADKASGSADLSGRLPNPGHLLCVSGLCPPSPPPHRLCGAESSFLHLPLGPHCPAKKGLHCPELALGNIHSTVPLPRGPNGGSQCQETVFISVQVSAQITMDINRSGMQAESQ